MFKEGLVKLANIDKQSSYHPYSSDVFVLSWIYGIWTSVHLATENEYLLNIFVEVYFFNEISGNITRCNTFKEQKPKF